MEKIIKITGDSVKISDGHHTFEELYDHRITLFIALCRQKSWRHTVQATGTHVWRSKLHSDGTSFDGWFVLGINKQAGKQITYHLPIDRWDETDFADILENAPIWDGHTSDDVLKRLGEL